MVFVKYFLFASYFIHISSNVQNAFDHSRYEDFFSMVKFSFLMDVFTKDLSSLAVCGDFHRTRCCNSS